MKKATTETGPGKDTETKPEDENSTVDIVNQTFRIDTF